MQENYYFAEIPKPRNAGSDIVGIALNTVAVTYGILPYVENIFLLFSQYNPVFQYEQYILPLIFSNHVLNANMAWIVLNTAQCLIAIPAIRVVTFGH